eukprot:4496716-Pyramimonas_sp.AAC.1
MQNPLVRVSRLGSVRCPTPLPPIRSQPKRRGPGIPNLLDLCRAMALRAAMVRSMASAPRPQACYVVTFPHSFSMLPIAIVVVLPRLHHLLRLIIRLAFLLRVLPLFIVIVFLLIVVLLLLPHRPVAAGPTAEQASGHQQAAGALCRRGPCCWPP